MDDQRSGGLAGRSRKAKKRRHANHSFSQQLIDDYLDADMGEESLRRIPIRGRSDFFPTVISAVETGSQGEDASVEQLELPLGEPVEHSAIGGAERQFEGMVYAPAAAGGPVTPSTSESKSGRHQEHDRVAHFEMFEFARKSKSVSFSMKRFLYGCLLGSGAAAVMLLMLQMVL